jgi:hypothetical protein
MASSINASTSGAGGVITTADSSGVLNIQTAGNTAVTVDASQNVGIGTAIPNSKLHVSSGAATITGASSTTARINMFNNAATTGGLLLGQGYASGTDNTGYIFNVSNAPVVFGTNDTERMRIDTSGNLLLGTATTASGSNSPHIQAGAGINTRPGSAGTYGGNVFNINWTGSAQLWIDSSNIGTITVTSDYRIKKNIETSTTPALNRIAQIRPVTYEFANYGELFKEDGVAREGFIAHELAEVIPSAVEGEKDAEDQIQSLKLDALCSVMVKAIQEQQTIINDLKARIEVLEAK